MIINNTQVRHGGTSADSRTLCMFRPDLTTLREMDGHPQNTLTYYQY